MVRRLNMSAIVVLSGGLIFAAAYLATSGGRPSQPAAPDVDFLLQKLADRDPQVSLDAEKDLLRLGDKVRPELERAAKSGDPRVAPRAKKILDALKPAAPSGAQ